MSKQIEGSIECPFYLNEGNSFISCEGVLSSSACTHTFTTNSDKKQYELDFCSVNGGRKCPHYRSVLLLYETGKRV